MANKKEPLAVFETAFDVYHAWSVIGEGGAGRVYAVTSSDGAEYALKTIRPEISSSDRRKRFKNEVHFLLKDRHRNIIRVVDAGVSKSERGGAPFYVMPRLAETLRGLMNRGVNQDQVLPLFSQVLDGIEAAHLFGVIHRDIKPENILHHPAESTLLLADFGIAHFEEEELRTAVESKQNDRLANFLYAAPEQRVRNAVVDHRADIFALGLLLNEMFTSAVPHGVGYRTVAGAAPKFSYLDQLVESMIQQDPGRRPNSIDEVKKELLKRQNEFIALQRLDEKKREVVPAYQPDEVIPVTIADVDWDGETLSIGLSRIPEQGWIDRFRQPREGYSAIAGKGPEAFEFRGDRARIDSTERQVETLLAHFNQYSRMGTAGYQRDLQEAADVRRVQEQERLRREQLVAGARARVLGKLKY